MAKVFDLLPFGAAVVMKLVPVSNGNTAYKFLYFSQG
jgi:hypothetical protein